MLHMLSWERTQNYYKQNGCKKLTPKQLRRLKKKWFSYEMKTLDI